MGTEWVATEMDNGRDIVGEVASFTVYTSASNIPGIRNGIISNVLTRHSVKKLIWSASKRGPAPGITAKHATPVSPEKRSKRDKISKLENIIFE